jgi:hypothetical protein
VPPTHSNRFPFETGQRAFHAGHGKSYEIKRKAIMSDDNLNNNGREARGEVSAEEENDAEHRVQWNCLAMHGR